MRGDQSLVYVTNLGDNTVSVIDTATNTVVATIPVGNSPTLIALSPDNTRAYVANQGSDDCYGHQRRDQYGGQPPFPSAASPSVPRSVPTALAFM